MSSPIYFITGPTATGKTAAAIDLALEIGGEVISADSMQVYRGMDIGTAKPAAAERHDIPHHMIDIADPDESFSVADFQKLALAAIDAVRGRGRVPIVAGGTGFYVNSLLYRDSYSFREAKADSEYRESLYRRAQTEGPESVHRLLQSLDPLSAERIHPRNVKRVIRALEYIRQTGEPFPRGQSPAERRAVPGAKVFILTLARDIMYDRIDIRIEKMIAAGLVDEVKGLLDAGYAETLTSMQGLGYKEAAAHIMGRATFDEFKETLRMNTRRFAKRQLTWFRGQCRGEWIDAEGLSARDFILPQGKD